MTWLSYLSCNPKYFEVFHSKLSWTEPLFCRSFSAHNSWLIYNWFITFVFLKKVWFILLHVYFSSVEFFTPDESVDCSLYGWLLWKRFWFYSHDWLLLLQLLCSALRSRLWKQSRRQEFVKETKQEIWINNVT